MRNQRSGKQGDYNKKFIIFSIRMDWASYCWKNLKSLTISQYVSGESGTGKELFARAIHNSSPRSDKPMIALNCGAIVPDLIDSILYDTPFTHISHEGLDGVFNESDIGELAVVLKPYIDDNRADKWKIPSLTNNAKEKNMRTEDLKKEINQLELSEKILLVEDIWDNIAKNNNELTLPEWQKKELDRRYQEYKDGKLALHDWKDVHEDLRNRYKWN